MAVVPAHIGHWRLQSLVTSTLTTKGAVGTEITTPRSVGVRFFLRVVLKSLTASPTEVRLSSKAGTDRLAPELFRMRTIPGSTRPPVTEW
jgi:hypothetical protein